MRYLRIVTRAVAAPLIWMWIVMCAIVSAPARAQSAAEGVASPAAQQPVVLDSVIAVVNGDVLLRSDLHSEEDMAALQTVEPAAGRRTLSAGRHGGSSTAA